MDLLLLVSSAFPRAAPGLIPRVLKAAAPKAFTPAPVMPAEYQAKQPILAEAAAPPTTPTPSSKMVPARDRS